MGGAAGLVKSDPSCSLAHPLPPLPIVSWWQQGLPRPLTESVEVPRGRRPPRPGCAPRRLSRRSPMSLRSLIRQRFSAKPQSRARLSLEALEDRLAPAVQLTYGGPGSVLDLKELISGATPSVSISESAPGRLEINLGAQTFDPSSTAQVTGLTYEVAGSSGTSNFATVDISQANNITTLQAVLSGDALSLGVISNTSGGLGNVTASAGTITVTGLDTSHASAGNGNVDLKAAGALMVANRAVLETGTGTISLAGGVNPDGTASGDSGILLIDSGATVVSDNTDSSAITLRGTD